jgi:hypothetical protein
MPRRQRRSLGAAAGSAARAALVVAALLVRHGAAQGCAAGSPRFIAWQEDYLLETNTMEASCRADVAALRTNLIGRHGPPIEVEIKQALCYGSCQQFVRDVDFLIETSSCTCSQLDTVYPLSALGYDLLSSWCERRPTTFLARETGIISDWSSFNSRYCQCSIAIACQGARVEWSPLALLAVLAAQLRRA